VTDKNNPSQEERSGVFEGIRGQKSQDTDVVEEQQELALETAEPEKPASAGETAKSKEPDVGKTNADKQRIARLERQLAQLGPWAQFGMAVGGDPKGKRIVDKYQRGEPLFEEEVAYLEDQVEKQQEKPLTREDIRQELDERDAGKALMDELNSMAEEELDGFKKIKRNPKFLEFLDFARQSVWQGRTELDEGVLDWQNEMAAKEMTAIKRAYNLYLADNPKVLEAAKKAGQKQEQERREALQSVPTSEGTTTSSQEEPEETSSEEDLVKRMMNVRGRGKSFATVGSKR
jgi:hypothetical protein